MRHLLIKEFAGTERGKLRPDDRLQAGLLYYYRYAIHICKSSIEKKRYRGVHPPVPYPTHTVAQRIAVATARDYYIGLESLRNDRDPGPFITLEPLGERVGSGFFPVFTTNRGCL
jgi:hypothetical protein